MSPLQMVPFALIVFKNTWLTNMLPLFPWPACQLYWVVVMVTWGETNNNKNTNLFMLLLVDKLRHDGPGNNLDDNSFCNNNSRDLELQSWSTILQKIHLWRMKMSTSTERFPPKSNGHIDLKKLWWCSKDFFIRKEVFHLKMWKLTQKQIFNVHVLIGSCEYYYNISD